MTQQPDDPTQPPGDAAAAGPAPAAAAADSGAEANASTRVSALRITVARSGGVAGVRPSWSVTAEREADVDSWLSLVESCPWDAADPDPATGGGADRFVYTIRVVIEPPAAGAAHPDAAAPREHDARVPERALDGPWGALVDRVKDASKH